MNSDEGLQAPCQRLTISTMSAKQSLVILCLDDKVRNILEKELELQGLDKDCVCTARITAGVNPALVIQDPANSTALPKGFSGRILEWPVRLGSLLDHIKRLLHAQGPAFIKIGPYRLDITKAELSRKGTLIKLTEKESDILQLLQEHNGESLSRQKILDALWGYAQDVETHTLETHMYRLRQKIEKDPGKPKIIITENDGYRLYHC